MDNADLAALKAVIVERFPELAEARFALLTAGWDSVAVDVDDRLIFKFPRNGLAEQGLRTEAALLGRIRAGVDMAVPNIALFEEPRLFSRHDKIAGEHLLAADYERLSAAQKQALGEVMGWFYAQLHALPDAEMVALGAGPVEDWLTPAEIRAKVVALLARPDLSDFALRTLDEFEVMGPDPHGVTYGYFDGHGWNMAFDHAAGRLNGLYDFGDSGVGPLHQEFIYSNFVSRDLTARIIAAYERESGRMIDRQRVDVLTGVHRLWEWAVLAEHEEHGPDMLASLVRWVGAD